MKTQYDRIGKRYLAGQKTFFKGRKDESFDFIKKAITSIDFKNKKILDVGCGDSRYMRELEKLGAKKVYGLEESKVMWNEAKRMIDPNRLLFGSIERSKISSGSFDIIYSRFALQHLKMLDQMYREVSRLLTKGGVFIFAVPHPVRDIMLVKSREYKGGQSFGIKLFKNKVPIIANMHPVGEYLSPVFFKLFHLKALGESKKSDIQLKGFKVPEYLGVVASKI